MRSRFVSVEPTHKMNNQLNIMRAISFTWFQNWHKGPVCEKHMLRIELGIESKLTIPRRWLYIAICGYDDDNSIEEDRDHLNGYNFFYQPTVLLVFWSELFSIWSRARWYQGKESSMCTWSLTVNYTQQVRNLNPFVN